MSDLSVVTDEDLPGPDRLRTYFLDLATAVRAIVGKPETVRELAARILVMVPCQYKDIEEDRANLEDRTVYFSNKRICTVIKEDQVTVLPNLNSTTKKLTQS